MFRHIAALLTFLALLTTEATAQRQMERLGRGVVALKSSSTQVYVGWRLLGNDPDDIAFNLYRSANGAAPVKVNSAPITATTDYSDTPGNLSTTAYTYTVRPVRNGTEVTDIWANLSSGPFTLPANAPTRQYLPVPMQPTPDDASAGVSYSVKFCWVGDIDGDGEYDFVVDRTNPKVDARQWLQAYKRDGTLLWQMNMGPNSVNHYNITPGSSSIGIGHGDNVTVYDLDGDGKAEVIVRTANGVIFADGTTLNAPDDVTQYISILEGTTGKEKARATIPNPWLSVGQMNGHMGIVYADGMKPSVFWQSSNRNADQSFNDIATTWDYRNGVITQRWSWPFTGHTATAHQIRLADVDNDGKDEYIDIGVVLKSDGTAQLNPGNLNEVIHGDRFHVADIDPDRPGLETFLIQQNNGTGLATVYQSADKATTIKKWYAGGVVDVGRGVVGAFDPGQYGLQFFSTQPGTFDSKGNQIYAANPFPPEAIWWDADLGREFIATVGSTATSPAISKFNVNDPGNPSRLYTIYNETPPGVYQAYGGRPAFWGDLFGDWREELLCVANDNSEMRIYTTKIPDIAKSFNGTGFRIYTLMHNPQYRIQTTTKGYVQSSYVDYYLGYGMPPPPPPPMVDAKLVWRGGSGTSSWDLGTSSSWQNAGVNSTYSDGDTVRFDISGNNATTVTLTGTLQPGGVAVYSPKDYTFGGTGGLSGSMKLTKAGSGALTLSGIHTYTGSTTVWDGALVSNGDLQQSPVTVWGGAWGGKLASGKTGGRLAGTGRFSKLATIKYRGTITPGAGMNSVGTLTFGAGLTAENGSTFALDLSNDPTGISIPSDRIAVVGNLTLTGTVNLVINPINTQLVPGTYTLLTYTGTLTGSAANLAVTAPAGTPYTIAAGSGKITLTVPTTRASAAVTWRGSGPAWDIATSQNWLRAGSPDVFVAGDTVTFDATGATNPTVQLTNAVPIGGVTVNAAASYTLAGPGSVSGTGGLTKAGTGTLTLATTNDYIGPTVINAGVLAVDNLNDGGTASSLGAASTNASNLVINGGTLRLTGSQTNTNRSLTLGASGGTFDVAAANSSMQISGVITGAGLLTKNGLGTLILASANTYTGNTILNSGTIYLAGATPNTSGLGTGTVTINNGTLTMSDVQANETAAWNLIVPSGAVARLNLDGRCSLTGTLTGAGTFTVWTGYVRTDLHGDWSAFTGQINVTSDSAGGDFRVTANNGYAKAALNLGDQVYAYYNITNSSATIDIGELSGVSTSSLSGTPTAGRTVTWRIGAKNTDSTFAGVITNGTGPTAISKTGTGTLTLDPSDDLSLVTTTSAGSATVTMASTSGLLPYMPVSGAGIPSGTIITTVVNATTLTLSNAATASGTPTLAYTTISTYTGATTVTGGTLIINRVLSGSPVTVQTGATLGGRGNIVGNVTVNVGGTLATGLAGSLTVSGNLTNNGTVRISGGGKAAITGTFTNNGVLDLITGLQTLPPGFVNKGTVLDSSVVKAKAVTVTGSDVNVAIQSYPGHNYQLQKRASLISGNWADVIGVVQSGTGNIITLTESGGASGTQGYYRVVVSP